MEEKKYSGLRIYERDGCASFTTSCFSAGPNSWRAKKNRCTTCPNGIQTNFDPSQEHHKSSPLLFARPSLHRVIQSEGGKFPSGWRSTMYFGQFRTPFFGRMSRDPTDVVNSYKLLFANERTECIIFGRLPSGTIRLVFVASSGKREGRANQT